MAAHRRAGANTDAAERYFPKKHLPAQAPRLTAETETIVLVMRRNEGVPPYRRIRPQTKRPHLTKKTLFNQACPRTALSLRGAQRATRQSPGREHGRNGAAQTQPARLWRLCHRAGANTDAAERYFPKKHLPAVAHRREIPRNRNEDDRTRASQMPARAPCRASPLACGGSPHHAEEIALRLTQTTKYNNSIFGGII